MVIGFIISVMGIFLIMTMVKVSNTSLRKIELKRAVSESVEDTLTCVKNKKYSSNDKMLEDYQMRLSKNISSDGKIKVKVLTADYKKGILDVSVTEYYGKGDQKRQITVRKTGIIDEK